MRRIWPRKRPLSQPGRPGFFVLTASESDIALLDQAMSMVSASQGRKSFLCECRSDVDGAEAVKYALANGKNEGWQINRIDTLEALARISMRGVPLRDTNLAAFNDAAEEATNKLFK